MKGILAVAAVVVFAYFIIFMNAVMVYTGNIPEDVAGYWLGQTGMQIAVFSALLIIPAHLVLVISAVRKKAIEWSTGVPFFLIPYMLGASVQAIVF